MRLRVVFLDGLIVPLWAFVAFINLGIFGFNILLVCLGVVFGLVFGAAVALKQISSIEENGEFKATLKTWALALLAIIILISMVYFLFSLGLEVRIQMLSLLYPFIPAPFAARIILYLNWERKHKRRILSDGLVFTRVYAVSN